MWTPKPGDFVIEANPPRWRKCPHVFLVEEFESRFQTQILVKKVGNIGGEAKYMPKDHFRPATTDEVTQAVRRRLEGPQRVGFVIPDLDDIPTLADIDISGQLAPLVQSGVAEEKLRELVKTLVGIELTNFQLFEQF